MVNRKRFTQRFIVLLLRSFGQFKTSMMAFTIRSEEDVVSLLKTVPLPEVVSVGSNMKDIVPEEKLIKYFNLA